MMAFTTLLLAIPIVVLLHHVFIAHSRMAWLSRLIVVSVGVALMLTASVHFLYIGIEVILIGLAWIEVRLLLQKRGQ